MSKNMVIRKVMKKREMRGKEGNGGKDKTRRQKKKNNNNFSKLMLFLHLLFFITNFIIYLSLIFGAVFHLKNFPLIVHFLITKTTDKKQQKKKN